MPLGEYQRDEALGAPLACVRRGREPRKTRRRVSALEAVGAVHADLLDCDGHECVVTGDGSVAALEAAHLVPAKNGENDMPCDGIALRADLHRLFDAGLFTFDERGQVLVADRGKGLSPAYRRSLRGARLPPRTLDRVGVTLALPQFHERQARRL